MTSKNKQQRTPFVVSGDGTPYIEAHQAGMSFLCLVIDGVPLTYFGKEKTPHITLDRAIKWHEDEIAKHPEWPRKYLDALLKVRDRFNAGDVTIKEPKRRR